jgi:DNA-3-methyladenine glycosylase II
MLVESIEKEGTTVRMLLPLGWPAAARGLAFGVRAVTNAIDIERYLSKKDPDLGRAIAIVRVARGERMRPPPPTDNPFQALVRAVIYQRSSEASGQTVFLALEKIAGGKLTPARIAALTSARIEKAGVSLAKATYVKNVATWFADYPAVAKRLPSMSTEEVHDALTAIGGIGPWSVNVLLVFQFGRLDVAPAADAVIRGIARKVYGLRTLPSVDFVQGKIEKWRPYRSVATMYLYQLGKLKLTDEEIRTGRAGVDQAAIRSRT